MSPCKYLNLKKPAALRGIAAPTKASSRSVSALFCLLYLLPAAVTASEGGVTESEQITMVETTTSVPEKIEVPGTYSGIQELPGGMYIVACKGSKGVCFSIEVEEDGRILLLTKDKALKLSSVSPITGSEGSSGFYRFHSSTP